VIFTHLSRSEKKCVKVFFKTSERLDRIDSGRYCQNFVTTAPKALAPVGRGSPGAALTNRVQVFRKIKIDRYHTEFFWIFFSENIEWY